MVNNVNLSDIQLFNQIYENDKFNLENQKNYHTFKSNKNFLTDNNLHNDYLLEGSPQNALLDLLKINFKLTENFEEVFQFLNEYSDLIDVIDQIYNLFHEEFPGDLLEIKIISRINEEKRLGILVYTHLDGFNASRKIEIIEDKIYNEFGNIFEKILISAEFLE